MNFLITIAASLAVTLSGLVGIYNYVPINYLDYFDFGTKKLGSTITTILGTDTLKDSRATINTNFQNLNDTKLENAISTGFLNFGYLTASSTTSSTTLQSVNIYGTLAVGGSATTTIKGNNATSTFAGINTTILTVGSTGVTTIRGSSATSTFGNGIR